LDDDDPTERFSTACSFAIFELVDLPSRDTTTSYILFRANTAQHSTFFFVLFYIVPSRRSVSPSLYACLLGVVQHSTIQLRLLRKLFFLQLSNSLERGPTRNRKTLKPLLMRNLSQSGFSSPSSITFRRIPNIRISSSLLERMMVLHLSIFRTQRLKVATQ
jgi:hypothetical protein